jgi:diacylglycerol kinase family enzyme
MASHHMLPRHTAPHHMVIIFNPVAGRRRAALLWRVLDVLAANGIRLDLAETHRAGNGANSIWRSMPTTA